MAVPLEDPGNLAGGGARGQDVVHQDQIRSRESPRLPEPERVAHVPLSSLQVESELGQGRTRPVQTREHRQVQSSAQGTSQEQRLVESPFPPASRMGGHRNEPAWREGSGPLPVCLLQQGRQRMRQPAVAGELEAVDQLPQVSGVGSPGPNRMMEVSGPPARLAEFRSPWIRVPIRNRQLRGRCRPSTCRAEAGPEPGQLQETFGAKGTCVEIGDPAAAKDTALGEKEDLEPLEEPRAQSSRGSLRNRGPSGAGFGFRNASHTD